MFYEKPKAGDVFPGGRVTKTAVQDKVKKLMIRSHPNLQSENTRTVNDSPLNACQCWTIV